MARRASQGIRPEVLSALTRAALSAREQVSEINADVANDRKEAVNEHNLHPGAFSLCVRLKAMDQVKRLAFLAALDEYRDILKLDEGPQVEAFPEQQGRAA